MGQRLKAGQSLQGGTYRIEKVLGQGSFGITYLATTTTIVKGKLGDMKVEYHVAIKEFFMGEINSRKSDGSTVEGSTGNVFSNYRKKFKREAENLAKLTHPNIVKVFDVFDENNTTYYVMEYLEGSNFDDYIAQKGHLSEDEAISITQEIGSALSYMHSHKMLHLDIKPKNIMRKADGTSVLIDFGLAKQYNENDEPESSTTIGLGTPGYAPLEQASYKQDGTFPSTLDVYALGATMFKMLTGQRPPEASYILNNGFQTKEMTEAGVTIRSIEIVQKSMNPVKGNRFQNIKSFIEDLVDNRTSYDAAKDTTIDTTQHKSDSVEQSKAKVDTTQKNQQADVPTESASNPNSTTKQRRKKVVTGTIVGLLAAVVLIVSTVLIYNEAGRRKLEDSVTNYYSGKINGHAYVDLGLPSGNLWATCNVGASSPKEAGDFFAWGETSTKSEYTDKNSLTYGKNFKDISGNSSYDAARANLGGSWRMPTKDEFQELIDNCTWTWKNHKGHRGYLVTGPNGNKIFIPTTETYSDFPSIYETRFNGDYWSSTPLINYHLMDSGKSKEIRCRCCLQVGFSWSLYYKPSYHLNPSSWINNNFVRIHEYDYGYMGKMVRAVSNSTKENQQSNNPQPNPLTKPEVAKAQTGVKLAPKQMIKLTGHINGHEYVDLGLPSGLKWATCNVGASSPEGYGNHYAWGETATKSEYNNSNSTTYKKSFGDISGNSYYDVARANWGNTWRLPTSAELQELVSKCTWKWVPRGTSNGYEVTGPNGRSIFLPASGYRTGSSLNYAGEYGSYWSSSPYESSAERSYRLYFISGGHYVGWDHRGNGFSVRPVSE